ncbi:hypothetical protein IG631_23908 [Alternaria alternata]|nr:hypothetical protein IG631_23908 [Alternaria alternata]
MRPPCTGRSASHQAEPTGRRQMTTATGNKRHAASKPRVYLTLRLRSSTNYACWQLPDGRDARLSRTRWGRRRCAAMPARGHRQHVEETPRPVSRRLDLSTPPPLPPAT